jgi:hypothetical protein
VATVLLAWAWNTQLPELRERLEVLAAPGGWQAALPY